MAAHPQGRFEDNRKPVILSRPVKARLDALKTEMETDKHRQVTFSEVVEYLLDRDAREAGQ